MAMMSDQFPLCPLPPPRPMTMDGRWRTNIEPAPNCPRCASSNTKFCYYNNYSLTQPRYFCKGCRRYWTKGGSLRSVPVGGGCRKSRRSRSYKRSTTSTTACLGGVSVSPNSSSSCQESSAGSDIDLAAVFAKFLSNDQGNNNDNNNNNVNEDIIDEAMITNTPSEEAYSHDSLTSSTSCGLENSRLESEKFTDDVIDQDFQVIEEEFTTSSYHNKQIESEDAIHHQDFINPGLAPSFDDLIDDVFWSDASTLSGLTWQPVAQSQAFDSPLLPADQSNIIPTPNLLSSCDNWSCFDTTGFEAFSTHS